MAGEIVQKFVTYRVHVAIVGNIDRERAASRALHDFVFEANRVRHIWFVTDLNELEERLAARQ